VKKWHQPIDGSVAMKSCLMMARARNGFRCHVLHAPFCIRDPLLTVTPLKFAGCWHSDQAGSCTALMQGAMSKTE
jgi:hypothetical protein